MQEVIIQSLIDAKRGGDSYRDTRAYANLTSAIEEAQGKCRARTIDPDTVIDYAVKVTRYLDIPKCHMEGVLVTVDVYHNESYHKNYKTPVSTHFTITYRKCKWRLVHVWRDYIGRAREAYISLPQDARDAIVDRFSTI